MNEYQVGLVVMPARDHTTGSYSDIQQIRELIRQAFNQAGLGQKNPEAPLAEVIEPGMSVLLKPNWVLHYNQSGQGLECMVTHPNFILAALQEVLAAHPGRVIIGDSPIQSCDFEALVPKEWREMIRLLTDIPLDIIDFRRSILTGSLANDGVRHFVRSKDHYVLFDLMEESLLEPLSQPEGKFRVTSYDPREMAKTHRPGRHQYLLCREAFDVDVIFNLPKLKSHSKAGITAALKNLVGLNGNKDYLPHHRIGGSALGGDCYPGISPLRRMAEYCLDKANREIDSPRYQQWKHIAYRILKLQEMFGETNIEGSWHGNDTVWRMALDLNRLLLYGKADGSIQDNPVRKIFTLTDGLVAGQGNGPLAPTPVYTGFITFASSSPFADLTHAALMRFDWGKIPLVRESFASFRYPLVRQPPDALEIFHNANKMIWYEAATQLGRPFEPPRGWKGSIELKVGQA